jgi:hypothetical protein
MHGSFDSYVCAPAQASIAPTPITFVAMTLKQRDCWSGKLLHDRQIKGKQRDVLSALALSAHLVGGRLAIDPTYAELAEAADCEERTAYRAIKFAEAIGIIRKKRHSDGRVANSYELVLSNGAERDVDDDYGNTSNCGNPDKYGVRVLIVEEEVEERVPPITNRECAAPAARTARVDRVSHVTGSESSFPITESAPDGAFVGIESFSIDKPVLETPSFFESDGSNNARDLDDAARSGEGGKISDFKSYLPGADPGDLRTSSASTQNFDETGFSENPVCGKPLAKVGNAFPRIGEIGVSETPIFLPGGFANPSFDDDDAATGVFETPVDFTDDAENRTSTSDLDDAAEDAHLSVCTDNSEEAMFVDATSNFPEAGRKPREVGPAQIAERRRRFDRVLAYYPNQPDHEVREVGRLIETMLRDRKSFLPFLDMIAAIKRDVDSGRRVTNDLPSLKSVMLRNWRAVHGFGVQDRLAA